MYTLDRSDSPFSVVVCFSFFFSLTSVRSTIFSMVNNSDICVVYHATKMLEYTCLLREASQQSQEVKVAHVEDPMYQSHKWQLVKSRYFCNG